jgi:hypothetical protein
MWQVVLCYDLLTNIDETKMGDEQYQILCEKKIPIDKIVLKYRRHIVFYNQRF